MLNFINNGRPMADPPGFSGASALPFQQNNVLRFQIAMDDALLMPFAEHVANLREQPARARLRQRALIIQHLP